MVFFKKSFILLSFVGTCMSAGISSEETFLEEKPVRKAPLSKARQQALTDLELLSQILLSEIEESSRVLRDVIRSARDIAEGDSKTPCMQLLKKERAKTLSSLKKMQEDSQRRIRSLETDHLFFKAAPQDKKS